jgi:hypothetical protein
LKKNVKDWGPQIPNFTRILKTHATFFYFQSAALVAVANVYEYIDELSIRRMVMPKIKLVYEKNQNDLKIILNVLSCIERILDKLDKSQVWIQDNLVARM